MLDEGGARTQAAFVLGQGDRLAVGAAAFVAANGLGASEQQQLEAEAFRQMSLHGRVPHVPVAALVAATPADVVPLLLTAIAAPPTTALPSEEKFPPRFQRWRCPSARRRRTARGIATVCRRRPSAEAEAGGGSPLLVLVHCLDFAPPSAHEAVGILRGLANYTGDGAAITSGAWAKPPAVGDDVPLLPRARHHAARADARRLTARRLMRGGLAWCKSKYIYGVSKVTPHPQEREAYRVDPADA